MAGSRSLDPLPIDPFVPAIVDRVRRSRAVVVTAEPGAGKTTRLPPALLDDGPVILLQPRRVAARAIAQRIADERGWAIGREIGWQIRFERRFGPQTKLLVATEGVLTARLQQDPLLSAFRTIVLDEFHERSLHADLAIALAKQAWRARDDLRLVVMSATMDAESVSAFLDGCPVVDVPGRAYPVDITYAPGQSVGEAVAEVLETSSGGVLCFLPGAFEIRRAMSDIEARVGADVETLALHGSLDAAAQDRALQPSREPSRRRVVVATNVAETSVTVPGITAVVDSGMHKVARYDADRGIDSLDLERIPADAADQRAGRAGRLAPGFARRLWDARDRLRPHREAEIHRVDLSAPILDVIAWGGNPRQFEWFEPPAGEAIEAALTLLERLDAVHEGRLTDIGSEIRRLPVHPRLARMLIAARGARDMAQACAILSERHLFAPAPASTSSDLLSAVDGWHTVPPHVQRVAREIETLVSGTSPESGSRQVPQPQRMLDAEFRRAVLCGYRDRVAQRRRPGSPQVRLASGAGGVIAPQSGVVGGEFLVALDVQASVRPNEVDARIRVASLIDREWLQPNGTGLVHRFDRDSGTVKAAMVQRYDALTLAEHPTAPDPDIAAQLLADAWLERGPRGADEQLLRRLRFAGRSPSLDEIVLAAARGVTSLEDVHLAGAISREELSRLDREAPETLKVPSGRDVRVEYAADGTVSAAVKLQGWLFGLAETPTIGLRQEPVLLSLLAPNGRPVQVTRDLRSFWDRTYPEVRKELRGRYPKHPWPDDPWKAAPSARTKRRP